MSHVPPYERRPGAPPPGGDLVSGEAVVLELRLAKVASRSFGILIDITVQVLLLLALSWVLGSLLAVDTDTAEGAAVSLVAVVAVIVGYPLLFETLTRGRSPGKAAMGLRVVREDGGAVHVRHSAARALVGVIEIWLTLGVVALLTSLTSSKGKRVGDYVGGTVVVRERVPDVAGPAAAMPPVLAGWAATLDLSRLPDGLALSARQLLGRARDLDPGARYEMARRLADDVSRYVTPPPPVGCPPEAYLAAVVAERRRRAMVAGAPYPAPAAAYPAPAAAYPTPAAAYPTPAAPYQSPPPAPPAPPQPPPPPPPADGSGFAAPA